MKNKEKYKKVFSEYEMCDRAAPWCKDICRGNICKGCIGRFIEWSEQEALSDLTVLEEEVLKRIDPSFKYIARDKGGELFVYYQKPKKGRDMWRSNNHYERIPLTDLFDWITFDDAEPWRIDDLVKRPGCGYNTSPRDLVRPREKDIDVYAK